MGVDKVRYRGLANNAIQAFLALGLGLANFFARKRRVAGALKLDFGRLLS